MRKSRARTGQPKPRAEQDEVWEELWRARGGEKKEGDPGYAREDQRSELRLAAAYHNIDLEDIDEVNAIEVNEIEKMLVMLHLASGDELGNGIFAQALVEVKRLGFSGNAGFDRLMAATPLPSSDCLIEQMVDADIAAGMSMTAAINHVAMLFTKSQTFEGARKTLSRRYHEIKADPRPRQKRGPAY